MAKKKLVYNFDANGNRSWVLEDDNPTNYEHPLTHPASMIEESNTRRFVSDLEKTIWNNNTGVSSPTPTSWGKYF